RAQALQVTGARPLGEVEETPMQAVDIDVVAVEDLREAEPALQRLPHVEEDLPVLEDLVSESEFLVLAVRLGDAGGHVGAAGLAGADLPRRHGQPVDSGAHPAGKLPYGGRLAGQGREQLWPPLHHRQLDAGLRVAVLLERGGGLRQLQGRVPRQGRAERRDVALPHEGEQLDADLLRSAPADLGPQVSDLATRLADHQLARLEELLRDLDVAGDTGEVDVYGGSGGGDPAADGGDGRGDRRVPGEALLHGGELRLDGGDPLPYLRGGERVHLDIGRSLGRVHRLLEAPALIGSRALRRLERAQCAQRAGSRVGVAAGPGPPGGQLR